MKTSLRIKLPFKPIWLLLLALSTAPAAVPPARDELPNFDRRPKIEAASLMEDRRTAIATLKASTPDVDVDFAGQLNFKHVKAAGGFLTGPSGRGRTISLSTLALFSTNEAHLPTKAFVREHSGLFGFGPEALDRARVKREFTTPHNGLKTVVWEQELDGISVFESVFISHTTKRGELVSLSSQFVKDPPKAATAGVRNRNALMRNPTLDAQQAVAFAARNIAEELDASGVNPVEDASTDADKKQRFEATPLAGLAEVKLVWLPFNEDTMRLCWEVVLTSKARGEMYRFLVDVENGEVLLRHCLTEYISDATYRVYTSDSPSPFSPTCPTACTTQPPFVSRTLVTLSALNTNASPNGWIDDGGNQTLGNNVDAHTDRDSNNSPDLPRPQGSPFRTFDFSMDLAQAPSTYTNAAVTDLFYWCNWIHDRLYELGFTEAAGNFQNNNFGRGGLGNDALQADAQDGSGFNNANMSTPTDGSAPRMQMYLFDGPTPDRDGDFDHEIVIHEYVHGLSNRRVGGGTGLSALQSRGMGEGWSDWYGITLLSEAGDDVNGNYAMGGYATYLLSGLTQNYYFGIRRYPYSTDMTKNPLTFKDIDPAQASTHAGVAKSPIAGGTADSVHNQGEVWCVTLWEARANLIAKYGHAVGNELILRLVTDGMNLSPSNPNFLQARDGILQADVVNNGGANLPELWAAFAKRGMGYNASSPASSTTAGVVESFNVPDSLTVTPASGFTGIGPVGGPFSITTANYSLVNIVTNPVNWAASSSVAWLNLSLTGGTLPPGGTNAVTVSLNSLANTLGIGIYTGTVRFTNVTSGVTQSRVFTLRVGQPDYFTELFDTSLNDLDNQTLTFTPDGSTNFYSVCREPATVYPSDLTGATSLALSSHTFIQLTLSTNISIYGRSTNVIYVASEGHLTLLAGDSSGGVTLANHFSRPRVSASLAHFHPTESGGRVLWQQLSNRVAITFDKVVEWSTTQTNSFQIELFHDGRIRMTHLACGTTTGLVGLSAGTGIPAGFIESDLNSYGPCVLPMTVSIPPSATEGDGVLSGQGSVAIYTPALTNLNVTLTSSDTNEITAPASVTILAGQTNATFDLTIIDDPNLDGPRLAIITATATGFAAGADSILVNDNETATLSLTLPANVTEGGGIVQGAINASAAPTANIIVSLSSSDPTEITVPPTVFLPAGQTSAVFNITIVNDTQIDGSQTATITAQVTNWTSGTGDILVQDNEPTNIVVLLPASAREGNGELFAAAQVRIFGTLPTNLLVSVLSSDTTELTVIPLVTIFAGTTNTSFSVTVVDDPDIDSSQIVTVNASADGFLGGSTNMTITDNESPFEPFNPSPAHLATNVIQTSDLSWQSGAVPGEVITNDVYFGTTPTPGVAELLGTTTNATWELPLLMPQTTYYWQIVARKAGITPGPVWRFTTRGVDHFVWSNVASPQYVSEPFGVTVTAKDAFETTVSNFNGTVSLSSSGDGGGTTNMILGNITEDSGGSVGSYTLGYSITPNANLTVTHLRSYCGSKVSIWTDGGVLITSQNVNSPAGVWTETPVASPVTLLAGATYRLAFFTTTNYLARSLRPAMFPHGTINQGYQISGDTFPTGIDNRLWLVDLRYTVGSSVNIPIAPVVSGTFSNGAWTGNVTAFAPTTNLVLRADDGNGHLGLSNPFAVELQNDIAVKITDSPDPVSLGGNVTYAISVTNIGPASASDVVVSNILPAATSLVSVTTSQGTVTTNGNLITCNLGSMVGNASASITIVATTTGVGTLTNRVSVGRSDADAYLTNNSAVATTTVQTPSIVINDVSLFEGNSGTINAVFTVSVSPAPATAVSVNFATASSSAISPADFTATNGVLNFAIGQTNRSFAVAIVGDTLYELDETYFVNLSAPVNATLADSTGLGTIRNNDPIPTLSIGDATLTEGNSGTKTAVFPVTLSAASGLNVSANYSTFNGNASSGSDYLAQAGFLTFPAGSVSNSFTITIYGDLTIEPDEVFYVELSSVGNATLLKREGVGLIVNDDGLPGEVDRFVWSAVAATQYVGQPFNVTITALDAFDGLALNFTNAATLTGVGAGGSGSRTILQNFTPNNNSTVANFTLGYSFTPTNNLTVTHVRSYFGNKVSVWTSAGVLLTSQNVSTTAGVWAETPLTVPLVLTAGVTYRVAVYVSSGSYYWRTDATNTFPDGVINQSYQASGDLFPTTSDSIRWWAVDLRYTVGTSGAHPISPSVTGIFVGGLWNGNITALAPTTNLVVRASDGSGHVGTSSAMVVELLDDIGITVTDSPAPVALGATVTYSITVTNTGPAVATGVVVTNLLPPSASLVSVTTSQGTFATTGQTVACTLGTINSGGLATILLQVTNSTGGNITNIAIVTRDGADNFAGNNFATNLTVVVAPALAIADVTISEPNVTPTNAVFNVTLSVASPNTVTVNYATANGTATAGSDFVTTNGVLNFAPGQTNKTLVVQVLDDANSEPNETFTVTLSSPANATLGKAVGLGVIFDNDGPPEFQITALLTNNSKVVDHDALTGDDRGGVAISTSQVFVTGDSATARFAATDITGGVGLGFVRDSLCTDLRTETVYLLGNGSTPLTSAGGTVSSLIALNPTTGAPSGVVISLSQSFTMTSSGNGIFSGYGRIVVYTGGSVYDIYVSTGTVTARGAMPMPAWASSESWSVWGVAEFFNGSLYLTYRDSSAIRIARARVPDGTVTTVATFSNLSDMASFVVSPSRNRWYFHYEGGGQFGGTSETLGYADAQFSFASTNPPVIVNQPANTWATLGGTATFNVSVTGSAPLSYQWRFFNTNLPGQNAVSLSIPNVQSNHVGNYSVFVTNAFGSVTSSIATLTILPPGSGVAYLRSSVGPPWSSTSNESALTLAFGANNWQDLRFETVNTATLFSPGNGFIFMDGSDNGATEMETFLNSNRTLMENWVSNGGRLFLNSAPNEDNGMYFGFGANLVYSDSTTEGRAARPAHPIFNSPFVPAGTNWTGGSFGHATITGTNLTVLITNTSNGRFVLVEQLYGNGRVLLGGMTTHNFHTPATESANLRANILFYGNTPVIATNQPPVITGQPTNQTVTAGTGIVLSVTATGAAPLRYQWRKDDAPLSNQTNATLTLLNVQTNVAGTYSVVVSNAFGSVASSNAVLTVLTFPPAITSHPTNQTVTVGSPAIFSVVASGTAPLRYQWLKENIAILSATNASLTLSNVQINAAGNYSVVVSNTFGSVTSSIAVLTVLSFAPVITSHPTNLTVEMGSPATFSVVASGSPSLRYQWLKDNVGIVSATNASYSLSAVQFSNAGTYSVVVTNAFGSTNSSAATLTVVPYNTTLSIYAFDTGWYNSGGFHDPNNANYFCGDSSGAANPPLRDWFAFMIPPLPGPVTTAQLRINTYGIVSPTGAETLQLRHVNTPVTNLITGGDGLIAIYNDLADGVIYGSRSFATNEANQIITMNLNSAFITNVVAAAGQAFAIGGEITSLDATAFNNEAIFSSSFGNPTDVQLILTIASQPAQLKFLAPELVAGTLRLRVSTVDGSPITPDRASNIWVYSSMNISTPLSNWTALAIAPVLTNGLLRLDGINPTNPPALFFRAIEGSWNVRPLRLSMSKVIGNTFTLRAGAGDSSPLTPIRATKIRFYSSTNAALPFGSWQPIVGSPVLSNGMLNVTGLVQTNPPSLYFRAEESP